MPKNSKKSNKSNKSKSNKPKYNSKKSNKTKSKTKSLSLNRELLDEVPKEYLNYNHSFGFPPIKPKNNSYEKNVATFGIKNKSQLESIDKLLNLGF